MQEHESGAWPRTAPGRRLDEVGDTQLPESGALLESGRDRHPMAHRVGHSMAAQASSQLTRGGPMPAG